ncbi:acyltransferase [Shinella zoogloeoides]|uniref:acyltransferase n=1 Tax=Shinella zoogloeoides TaxID=352475 RepID=UPI001F565E5B|nr:acyltransferase [Shinella zoogloeoides]
MKLLRKIQNRLHFILIKSSQIPRRFFYFLLSNNRPARNLSKSIQPTILLGKGKIFLGKCNLGVWPSAHFLSGSIYIEAREITAVVLIEDGVWINNEAVIIAQRETIRIKAQTLIGTNFTVYDSDFHDLHPQRRLDGSIRTAPVTIGSNVFIGSHVTVLKGVTIGENSVISSGAVVSTDIPANVIAGGIPARVIGRIPDSRLDHDTNH